MKEMEQKINFDRNNAKEINLKELYKVFQRRIWAILIVTVIGAIGGFILNSASVTPLYQTSSKIILGGDPGTQSTLLVIMKDSSILDKVIKELQLQTTSDALASQIDDQSINSSSVVSISVTNPDPKLAAQIANTIAQVFKDEVPKIIGKSEIRLLSPAVVNTVPINPKSNNKLVYGVIGGLVLGIVVAFFLESLDDKVRPEQEIEKQLGLPVLGKVSKMNKMKVKGKRGKSNFGGRGEAIGTK